MEGEGKKTVSHANVNTHTHTRVANLASHFSCQSYANNSSELFSSYHPPLQAASLRTPHTGFRAHFNPHSYSSICLFVRGVLVAGSNIPSPPPYFVFSCPCPGSCCATCARTASETWTNLPLPYASLTKTFVHPHSTNSFIRSRSLLVAHAMNQHFHSLWRTYFIIFLVVPTFIKKK